jgi:hypothetical protein
MSRILENNSCFNLIPSRVFPQITVSGPSVSVATLLRWVL